MNTDPYLAGLALGALITTALLIGAYCIRAAWTSEPEPEPADDLHTCQAIWNASPRSHDTEWRNQ